MKRYLSLAVLVVIGVLAAVGLSAWSASTSSEAVQLISRILLAVVVFGGGIGSLLIRKRRERAELSAEDDSVEVAWALRARSHAFVDTLVIALAVALAWILLGLQFNAAFALVFVVVLALVAFWARYMIAKRHWIAEGTNHAEPRR